MSLFSTDSKSDIFTHLAIMIATILVFFFAFFFVYLPWTTNHGESVQVPNLKGLSLEQAKDKLDAQNLDYEVSDSVFVAGLTPLSIISNYPKTGANVKSGRKIYLTVAADAAPMVKMPNIIGRSATSAQNQLLSAGLITGEQEMVPALEENTILKVKLNGREIAAGEEIPKGSKITLVVGDGFGGQKIEVPNVVGMAQDEADVIFSGIGLSLGAVNMEPSSKPEGIITRQKPAVGEKINNGAPVSIWVSSGSGASTSDETNQ